MVYVDERLDVIEDAGYVQVGHDEYVDEWLEVIEDVDSIQTLVKDTLAQERGLSTHNLQLQAENGKNTPQEEAIADINEEKGEALEEIDHLSQRLIHATTELEEWDR